MSSTISIPKGGWVLLADHSKALLLKNSGTAVEPDLDVLQAFEAPTNPLTHDQGADRPGRAYAQDGRRSAVDDTDWHGIEAKRFIKSLVESVEAAANADDVQSLTLVAPPRALGELRDTLPGKLKSIVTGEVDKDLVRMPVADITRHLAG